jgi:hypothetical protein
MTEITGCGLIAKETSKFPNDVHASFEKAIRL